MGTRFLIFLFLLPSIESSQTVLGEPLSGDHYYSIAGDLMADCADTNKISQLLCETYILGILDAARQLNKDHPNNICVPIDIPVRIIRQGLIEEFKKEPKGIRRYYKSGSYILNYVRKKWPCHK